MKRFECALALVLLGLVGVRESSATDIQINSLSGNGVLTWTSAMPNTAYRVEWAPSLSSSWTSSWEHLVGIQTTSTACSVTVPMFYRVVGQQPPAYSFADYFPADPNIHRKKVFVETNFLSSSSTLNTNEITGFKKAPYASGAIIGVADLTPWYFYNNGRTVKFLGADGWFFSTDTNLTAHPSCWSFGQVYDSMIVTQSHYTVKEDRSEYDGPGDQSILIDIQTVTISTGVYSNAVIFWYLDLGKTYVAMDFHGTESELGIALPTAGDTEGYAVTDFEVYGRNAGLIAAGDVEGISGNLNTLKHLQSVVDP